MKVEYTNGSPVGTTLDKFKPGDLVKMVVGPYIDGVFLVLEIDNKNGLGLAAFTGELYMNIQSNRDCKYIKLNGKVLIE